MDWTRTFYAGYIGYSVSHYHPDKSLGWVLLVTTGIIIACNIAGDFLNSFTKKS